MRLCESWMRENRTSSLSGGRRPCFRPRLRPDTREAAEQRRDDPSAEVVEGRRPTEGNTVQEAASRTQSRLDVSIALERVREVARRDRRARFTALLHHVTVDLLRESFYALKRQAAPGVDGVTWQQYEVGLEDRLRDLHRRVHPGTYRATPSRRAFIPKADGRMRPLGIAALEDKIVQQAVVRVLNQIYEVDFLGFSYGFRPGRSQHDASGRALGGDHGEEGELGARCGHPWLL